MTEENIRMTRISDLPEIPLNNKMLQSDQNTMYIPMNVHPNPYGIPEQPPGGMPLPHASAPHQKSSSHENPMLPQNHPPDNDSYDIEDSYGNYGNEDNEEQEYRLPARDVPVRDITKEFLQDIEITPNYIPKPKITADYIKEYEAAAIEKEKEYEKEKDQEQKREEWFDLLQTPILVGILYFIFQLPIVNTLIFKRFSFMNIYREDGNFNLWGLLLKAASFSILFWSIDQLIYQTIIFLE